MKQSIATAHKHSSVTSDFFNNLKNKIIHHDKVISTDTSLDILPNIMNIEKSIIANAINSNVPGGINLPIEISNENLQEKNVKENSVENIIENISKSNLIQNPIEISNVNQINENLNEIISVSDISIGNFVGNSIEKSI